VTLELSLRDPCTHLPFPTMAALRIPVNLGMKENVDPKANVQHAVPRTDSQPLCRILCFGDSLTAGFYANGTKFAPYGDTLGEQLHAAGINAQLLINGQSGHKASRMLDELDSSRTVDIVGRTGKGLRHLLETKGPQDLVIIMAGTNDLGARRAVRDTFRDVCQLHAVCHEHGIPTIAVAPATPCAAAQKQLAGLLEKWVETQTHVYGYLNAEVLVPRSNGVFWDPDRLHFSPQGSKQLGHGLCEAVLNLPELWGFEDDGTPINSAFAIMSGQALWNHVLNLMPSLPVRTIMGDKQSTTIRI